MDPPIVDMDWQHFFGTLLLELKCAHDSGQPVAEERATIAGATGPHTVRFRMDYPALLVIVDIDLTVPERRRSAIAEAIVRANKDQLLGGFQFSMENGGMWCVAGIPLHDATVMPAQLAAMCYNEIALVDRYVPAFRQLCASPEMSPAAAIAAAERMEQGS